jgi:hypothetical protein
MQFFDQSLEEQIKELGAEPGEVVTLAADKDDLFWNVDTCILLDIFNLAIGLH